MTAKPVILTVDDDPGVLAAVERDLRTRYASDYRVVGATGGDQAIETLKTLAQHDDAVALLLVDQRMPKTTGIDVLRQSLALFPDAKKALLTAYADTDVAISAINDVELDNYIMKPWDPPEDLLYPILDDLLDDWRDAYRPVFDGLRVIEHRWSKTSHDLKVFLTQNQIPFRSIDLETDQKAQVLLDGAGASAADLPVVLFPDSEPMLQPSPAEVAERVGLQTHAVDPAYDLVVIGGGPAGLATSVYGASEGLSTLLIEERAPGGQAGESYRIENYLGFPKGISGADLTRRAVSQATRLGAEILVPASVERIERRDPFRIIHLKDGSSITAKAVIVASGITYRRLPATGVDELSGTGVYYGTSQIDGVRHKGESVYVVGGGNSAGQAALFLTRFTDDVTIVIRRDDLGATMSQYLIDAIEASPSVKVRANARIVEVIGEGHLSSLRFADTTTSVETEVSAGALFIFIGQGARTDWIAGLVELDDRGFIMTGSDLGPLKDWNVDRDPFPFETSVPGVFSAGDVRHGSIRRVAGATGEGATAVRFVHKHLADL
ncbi:MAG: FAD-dependent oxidoreductase [Actinobacteria bacterium]|nr:FAD-dependent oxidoreductase [Actinomycetota bacterium]